MPELQVPILGQREETIMPMGIYLRKTADERFWERVNKVENGCWEWRGCCGRNGYGMFSYQGQSVLAHRFSLNLSQISIPFGLEVDHLCRNRRCVNPSHLEIVTHQINVLRGNSSPPNKNRQDTHCPHGHPYDLFNTYFMPHGGRSCKACRRNWQYRKYWADKVSQS